MPPLEVRFTNPSAVATPSARFSQLATVPAGHDLLFIAGQTGKSSDGQVLDGIEAQYEQALRNVVAILREAGSDPTHLVKMTYLLLEPLDRERAAEIRSLVLGDAAPATTFAYVSGLARPEFLVEIEAVAAQPATSGRA